MFCAVFCTGGVLMFLLVWGKVLIYRLFCVWCLAPLFAVVT